MGEDLNVRGEVGLAKFYLALRPPPDWSPVLADSFFDIPLTTINGEVMNLHAYSGKVLLVVNVASKCGLTPQYEGLEALYREKRDQGLVVLGFPANNFGNQEPGGDAEIAEFCTLTYGVDFPIFSKISVNGADRHPLYEALIRAQPKADGTQAMREKLAQYGVAPGAESDVLWNFEKFLVGRDGHVAARFSPDITADDPRLLAAVEKALAATPD
jgi:glutathione peroxidase